ncbi:MAG: hypothetical protein OXC96_03615 [Cyanobacteria bacterium MAG CAR1_bin_15]|nr:hypothetical protein [Cyanobacteria bacterium MAG CAR1_bin_15]
MGRESALLLARKGHTVYAVVLSTPPGGALLSRGGVLLAASLAIPLTDILAVGDVWRVSISGHEGSSFTVTPTELVFTEDNWNVPQEVTITAPAGAAAPLRLRHIVSGPGYETATPVEIEVTVMANQEGGSHRQQRAWLVRERFSTPPPLSGLAVTVAGEELTSATALVENEGVLAKVLGFEPVTTPQLVEDSAFSFSPRQKNKERSKGRKGKRPGWASGAAAPSPPFVDKKTGSPRLTAV